jgi:hypothetical protein
VSTGSGKYRLGGRIGGGGMAEVFRGTLVGLEGFARPVAIKRMLPALSADQSFADMFKNEARLASLLAHPNIVSVLDFDRDEEGRLFIVMELVDGKDLRELQTAGRLPIAVSAFVIAQTLRALAYAHELTTQGRPLGMVHRDVSPHNVLISWDGAVKLSDFGIAKAMGASGASRTGALKGKVAYMSPEQAHGLAIDGRSDVFAVGVMFHELLTGERLFAGATEAEVLSRMLAQPIETPRALNPDVHEDVAAMCMGMLERDRDRRFGSARAALEALLNCDVVSARGQSELTKLMDRRFGQRFSGESPRRDESGPQAVVSGAAVTAPLQAVKRGRAAAMEAPTRTEAPGQTTGTPTAAGAVANHTVTDRSPRFFGSRRRGGMAMVLGGLLAAVVGAAAVAFALGVFKANEDSGARMVAGGPSLDPMVAVDASAVAHTDLPPAPPDAAPVVAVQIPDAAPAKKSRHRRRRNKPEAGAASVGRDPDPPERDPDPPKAEQQIRYGMLYVLVEPWANVSIKGHGTQTTPATWKLPEGKYKVVLSNEERNKKATVTVVIKEGRTETISRIWTK